MTAEWIDLSGNEVVAYNLRRARQLRDLTQEQAADHLEPFLGVRWSKATFSSAERSIEGERVRKFDADEILAFARAFDLPVEWFYLPPPSGVRRVEALEGYEFDPGLLMTPDEYRTTVRGSVAGRKELEHRLDVEKED